MYFQLVTISINLYTLYKLIEISYCYPLINSIFLNFNDYNLCYICYKLINLFVILFIIIYLIKRNLLYYVNIKYILY